MSQLDLSVEADVSTRHLSFVETGRSKPSRELVLHLAEHLDVPLRDRNALLLAAGYAPATTRARSTRPRWRPCATRSTRSSPVSTRSRPSSSTTDGISSRRNRAAFAILADGVAPELLAPPVNAMRVSLHPDGLAPRIVNLAEYSAHLLHRLRRQLATDRGSRPRRAHRRAASVPGRRRRPHRDAGRGGDAVRAARAADR